MNTLTEERTTILNRLRSAEGHLHGVIHMLEAGQSSEQVLHQLEAVEGALEAVHRLLRLWALRCCAKIILDSPDIETRLIEVQKLAALCKCAALRFSFAELTERESDE